MKSENLFWVVLLVCLTQSFFLIYLSSNIKELEFKVSVLSDEYDKSEKLLQRKRSEFQKQFKARKKERLENMRLIIREELSKHIEEHPDMTLHASQSHGAGLNTSAK